MTLDPGTNGLATVVLWAPVLVAAVLVLLVLVARHGGIAGAFRDRARATGLALGWAVFAGLTVIAAIFGLPVAFVAAALGLVVSILLWLRSQRRTS